MGEITWHAPKDPRNKKAMWKEEDKKYAYVFMVRFYIYHINVGF